MRRSRFYTVLPLIAAGMLCGCLSGPRGIEDDFVQSRIFRGKWFDYYNRAMHRLRDNEVMQAEQDLCQAIERRDQDSHRARTYGVHFQRYYPNRELGILALEKGDYEQALQYLALSYQQAPTARGIYFLNEARRARIHAKGLDRVKPTIRLAQTSEKLLTNQRNLQVKGAVSDDTYVSSISVNGNEEFFQLAESEKQFAVEVQLVPGSNTICVAASDLGKRRAELSFEAELDVQGPTLSLREILVGDDKFSSYVRLAGAAFDRNGIVEFRVGDKSLGGGKSQIDFENWFPVKPNQDALDYRLKDICGNESRGRISLDANAARTGWGNGLRGKAERLKLGHKPEKRILLASAAPLLLNPFLVGKRMPGAAEFDFGRLAKWKKVYLSDFFINGSVYDPDGIEAVKLDGVELRIVPGLEVYFSYLADLQPATNTFTFEVTDKAGQQSSAQLELYYEQPLSEQKEERLKVAVYDFATVGSVPSIVSERIQTGFEREIREDARFNMPNRAILKEILVEQKIAEISSSDWPDLAKMIPAEVLLFGKIIELRQGLDIFLKMVNAKRPDSLIGELNVYQPDKGLDGVKRNMRGLYVLLKNEFPRLEGKVIHCRGNRLVTDLGVEDRVHPGFDLLVTRKAEHIVEDGIDYGVEESDIGRAEVQKVLEKTSYASPYPGCNAQKGDCVKTR